ncbi:MAG: hypothetical protein WKG07_04660 [Hymenobacter sp.]
MRRPAPSRHGLLGLSNKPSKQDLQDVVTALQGIVDQDERIVAVLNQTTQQAQTTATTLQNTGRDDRNLTAQRLSGVQNEFAKPAGAPTPSHRAPAHPRSRPTHRQARPLRARRAAGGVGGGVRGTAFWRKARK